MTYLLIGGNSGIGLVSRKVQSDGYGEGAMRSMGSTRASRVVFGALAEDRPSQPFHAVSAEGVGNNTRGPAVAETMAGRLRALPKISASACILQP